MPKFTSFDQIEKYLRQKIPQSLGSSSGLALEDYLKDEMYQAIYDYVYSQWEPEIYIQRRDEGGLSDRRNMVMASPFINSSGQIQIEFENLTTGSDDAFSDNYIADLIEEGAAKNNSNVYWEDPTGPWAEPRPFIRGMKEKIKDDPSTLIAVIKHALEQSGFMVKW